MIEVRNIPALEQIQVRGRHERFNTDTAQLTNNLSQDQDFNQLIVDFDNGYTLLRDVGGMGETQRRTLLDAYSNKTVGDLYKNQPEIISTPIANLRNRVTSGPNDQTVGHNFFVNATGFIDAGFPWALQFDKQFKDLSGYSIHDLANYGNFAEKDQILESLTNQQDGHIKTAVAVYLAGRSQEGENYLEAQYGHILQEVRARAYGVTQNIGEDTGLSIDMIERAAQQLYRTKFGSFDHLTGLVTSDNSGAAGDYWINSLRIEVQFNGNIYSPIIRNSDDAEHVIAHELQHAASAQTKLRCGLQANGQGLEVNEGMTEYLAQLSLGSPGILQLENGDKSVGQDVPYNVPVLAMLLLHGQFKSGSNKYFAALFNAYHGSINDAAELEEALDNFYRLDLEISNLTR